MINVVVMFYIDQTIFMRKYSGKMEKSFFCGYEKDGKLTDVQDQEVVFSSSLRPT